MFSKIPQQTRNFDYHFVSHTILNNFQFQNCGPCVIVRPIKSSPLPPFPSLFLINKPSKRSSCPPLGVELFRRRLRHVQEAASNPRPRNQVCSLSRVLPPFVLLLRSAKGRLKSLRATLKSPNHRLIRGRQSLSQAWTEFRKQNSIGTCFLKQGIILMDLGLLPQPKRVKNSPHCMLKHPKFTEKKAVQVIWGFRMSRCNFKPFLLI